MWDWSLVGLGRWPIGGGDPLETWPSTQLEPTQCKEKGHDEKSSSRCQSSSKVTKAPVPRGGEEKQQRQELLVYCGLIKWVNILRTMEARYLTIGKGSYKYKKGETWNQFCGTILAWSYWCKFRFSTYINKYIYKGKCVCCSSVIQEYSRTAMPPTLMNTRITKILDSKYHFSV